MKKIVLLILMFLCVLCSVFAFEITVTTGCGYVNGHREFKNDFASYRRLAADGAEVGIVLSNQKTDFWRTELYFNYLFAEKGGISANRNQKPKLSDIDSYMRYTDYKLGFGVGYFIPFTESNRLRISSGFNFAGISNHLHTKTRGKTTANEIAGDKVTSFGIYAELAEHLRISEKVELVIDVHSCFNFFGFIRTLDATQHKWINHFDEKAKVGLFSIFAQTGICFNL